MKTSTDVKNQGASSKLEPLAISVAATADAIDSGERFVWNLIRDGQLEVSRIGGRTLVIVESLKRLLHAGTGRPARVTPRRFDRHGVSGRS